MRYENRDRMSIARRRAVHDWLVEQGMESNAAESWCDAWEAEATARGLHRQSLDFWREAGPWIAERLNIRDRSPRNAESS
jgi:hypothetical protein